MGAYGMTFPFVVSLSNHERPFDKLRANGFIIREWRQS